MYLFIVDCNSFNFVYSRKFSTKTVMNIDSIKNPISIVNAIKASLIKIYLNTIVYHFI